MHCEFAFCKKKTELSHKSNATIELWKSNFPPFQEIMTVQQRPYQPKGQPRNRQINQPTTDGYKVHREVTLPITEQIDGPTN